MTIGDRVKQRRQALGLSVDDIAKSLGKNRATVYRYESADIGKLPVDILEPLARVLETTPAYLMGWDESLAHFSAPPSWFTPLADAYAAAPTPTQENVCKLLDVSPPVAPPVSVNKKAPVEDELEHFTLLAARETTGHNTDPESLQKLARQRATEALKKHRAKKD